MITKIHFIFLTASIFFFSCNWRNKDDFYDFGENMKLSINDYYFDKDNKAHASLNRIDFEKAAQLKNLFDNKIYNIVNENNNIAFINKITYLIKFYQYMQSTRSGTLPNYHSFLILGNYIKKLLALVYREMQQGKFSENEKAILIKKIKILKNTAPNFSYFYNFEKIIQFSKKINTSESIESLSSVLLRFTYFSKRVIKQYFARINLYNEILKFEKVATVN